MISKIHRILQSTNEAITTHNSFTNNIPSFLKFKVKRKIPKNLPVGEFLYDFTIPHNQQAYIAELASNLNVKEYILRKFIFKITDANPNTRYITIYRVAS